MSVLLLQLAGPLQAWGASARFARRTTESAPTKSGVIGLLAAALGRERSEDLADLAALRFGVRVDQRGTPIRDYQTAHHFETGRSMPVSERFYLADAVFVAALEGPDDLIDELHQAVRRPTFLPYLGRRSCPPSRPIDLGVRQVGDVERALEKEIWRASRWYQRRYGKPSVQLETIVEATAGDGPVDSIRDQPLSFDPHHRRYALRGVRHGHVEVPNPAAPQLSDHDPTAVLGGV
ncbi:CRISPR system Cascade subunit CasD [Thermomonospora echinospora]|uniref:CRISPR system Cascade subunit CasD n=1 Tax=Thermomonospora echinospora TaxID=1992 RepID=A0A1H6EAE7_9ACTN|nr:type I-E CRISPR-associated protein Cas5/CasD [Thermomonospora echinospora]SEG93904.1 CRISPR system Cascade subunit CasD [Thermomonospora echinospora]